MMQQSPYTPKMRNAGWSEFLGTEHGHAVQIYADVSELAISVSAYLAAGFELGEPGVVVVTPRHLAAFMAALAETGWDAKRIDAAGILAVADAETTIRLQLRVSENLVQQPRTDDFARVDGHDRPASIGVLKKVVTASDAEDDETGPTQCCNYLPATQSRQARHGQQRCAARR